LRERDETMSEALALLAPGSDIREGIERVIGARRGALIVVGWSATVQGMVSGGFVIDAQLTAQRLSELAKMDGAIILDDDATRILRANVHLVPDPTISTTETGTRHRTAERVAKQTNCPVISVSESMRHVTLYVGGRRRSLEEVGPLLQKANQALQTLERYRNRLDEVTGVLSAREVDDAVTMRDVLVVLQRIEMLRRIGEEVEDFIAELGSEGRLIRLQLEELMSQVERERELVVEDYMADRRRKVAKPMEELDRLQTDDLLTFSPIGIALGYEDDADLDRPLDARGFRLLSRLPRVPPQVIRRLVAHFGTFPRLLEATVDNLVEVEGVGEARARQIREGLRRLVEATRTDRLL
jgi:diadenylate cyclase